LFFAKIDHAATVFDITASHKPPSWPTWNHGSALVIKGPAQVWLSSAFRECDLHIQTAQPRRLSNRSLQFIEDKMQSVQFAESNVHKVTSYLSNVRKNELNMRVF